VTRLPGPKTVSFFHMHVLSTELSYLVTDSHFTGSFNSVLLSLLFDLLPLFYVFVVIIVT